MASSRSQDEQRDANRRAVIFQLDTLWRAVGAELFHVNAEVLDLLLTSPATGKKDSQDDSKRRNENDPTNGNPE